MVQVICSESSCKKTFAYRKRSNVTRKFCDKCAASRVQASKKKSLLLQRQERQEEQSALTLLAEIPDYIVNPAKILDSAARELK